MCRFECLDARNWHMKMRESRDHLIYIYYFHSGLFLLFLHYLFTSVFVRIRINSSGVEVGLGPATIKFQAQYKIGRLSPHRGRGKIANIWKANRINYFFYDI